jgi:hypothetical protein
MNRSHCHSAWAPTTGASIVAPWSPERTVADWDIDEVEPGREEMWDIEEEQTRK